MKVLQERKPIWHALIWILAYVVIVNIGDNLSGSLGATNYTTIVLLVAFSLVLLFYLKKNSWFGLYGFKKIEKAHLRKALFFIPLFMTIPLHYFRGINQTLGYTGFILAIVQMTCVGFIEESVFRGFLYRGILKKGSMVRAVLISGATFGIGHIVNLARGYTLWHQIIQIIVGIFVGILLALIVALTKNILPCILWHIFFNISGTITNSNLVMETYMVAATAVVCILYSAYLIKTYRFKMDHEKKMSCN